VLHGEVEGVFPVDRSAVDFGGASLQPDELTGENWSYVALGHYHVQHQVGPRVWYSGALDYVSTNPWGELQDEAEKKVEGKAWLLVDLESGVAERRPVPLARRVIDLPRLEGMGLVAEELDALVAEAVAGVAGGITDEVVRQVVRNVPRSVGRGMNYQAIRSYKAQALHFQLDLRRPEIQRQVGVGAPGRRRTLPELVETFLTGRDLPADIEREALVRLEPDHDRDRAGVGSGLMHIERLRLVNFRQHEDTELVLGSGLTGIVGPNGAGKTTLLEAIAWALYGAEAARGTKETIRRRSASPRAPVRVELEFSLGTHRYRVLRGLSTAELYQDGDPTPVAHSLVEVTARIGRMLGMAREEFFNTYFTGQKQLAVMAAMRPVERAQFLSRVLGYDRLQLAQERVREHRVSVRARVGALQSSLTDPAELAAEEEQARSRLAGAQEAVSRARENHERAERRRAEVTPRWEATQRLQEQTRVLEGEFRLAEHKVQAARETFQRLDRQLVTANEARGRLEALRVPLEPLPALRVERTKLDAEAERHAVARAPRSSCSRWELLGQVEERINRLPARSWLLRASARGPGAPPAYSGQRGGGRAAHRVGAGPPGCEDQAGNPAGPVQRPERTAAADHCRGCRGGLSHLRSSARFRVRERDRHAGSPAARRAIQRQLLQTAHRAAGA
jgi:hypothetical protein